ncbi:hypothetical protein ACRALDRAFT_1056056 [Sodiomyces alcalophilus JCM 7366]|uniref:uncharacterized protein n=1 Tax=Sodiomyces alcalophilus JCM 7366 TaxID=591952 RepID=UPI0039B414F7
MVAAFPGIIDERLDVEVMSSSNHDIPALPYKFDTGVALFAKRSPRPFPPPFLSPPSGSFSDPLSTHHQSRDRRARVNGDIILGKTNGDDAVFASEYFICANDGVGAWTTRPRGHAGLWSRLILHFWANALREDASKYQTIEERCSYKPDPVAYLQQAYENTINATAKPVDWQGTTTVAGAQIHFKPLEGSKKTVPLLYVTNLGDCQVMVVRPKDGAMVYKTKEQWHWFDCPRQLGTNSPDTPEANAVMDVVEIRVGDVVLAMTDGVIDNLWEHDIVENVVQSVERWEHGAGGTPDGDRTGGANGGMKFAAEELVAAAKTIALDPYAESPFMEHAIDEGLASIGEQQQHSETYVKMRGKRSKQYRKLMTQYSQIWGFREPYQCLIDAEMVVDCHRFKYDLIAGLKRTLHGEVKPMISQCEIRKLYARKSEPDMNQIIEFAKTLERRRCGHLPEDYPEPLSTGECFRAVVDPKGNNVNKHKLVSVCQDENVRRMLRGIAGVPQIYYKRSVMIMEPMASESVAVREREEKAKYRAGLTGPAPGRGAKRKRTEGDDKEDENAQQDGAEGTNGVGPAGSATGTTPEKKKKKKGHGPKGPNPLAVKKKKNVADAGKEATTSPAKPAGEEAPAKKKRKRRHKSRPDQGEQNAETAPAAVESAGES